MKGKLTIEQSGLQSIVVDNGRTGQQKNGLSPGGPADRNAFDWANKLCGNPPGTATIEITLGNFCARFSQHAVIAVTGANMPFEINNQQGSLWRSYRVKPGDTIRFGIASSGMRCYLAVYGGVLIKPIFGSVTTVVRDKLGGLNGNGEPLKVNDELNYLAVDSGKNWQLLKAPPSIIPQFSHRLTLRFIAGYQYQQFSRESINRLIFSEYRVSNQFDRMGAQLTGPSIQHKNHSLYSEGITFGAIQIPPSGQPIVMLTDRQTIGGYPKVGSVLSLDCYALLQARPEDIVEFTAITMFDAHNLVMLEKQKISRLDCLPV